VAPDTWRALTSQVEADILGAPEAPDAAVSAAFRVSLTRIIQQPNTAADIPAMLDAYDGLTARIAARLPSSALPDQASLKLINKLEKLDARPELRARLDGLATSGNDRMRSFATGRLRVLEARETPLDLAFDNIAGEPITLEALRGDVVLLQFWATWCGPCRAEIPHLRAAYAAYRDRGFRIVGLSHDKIGEDESLDQARARVAAFMQDNGMDWPTQFDGSAGGNPYAKSFGVQFIPASLLLDRDGRVAAIDPRGDDIAAQVERLLA
jgi:thiol-disulfide isomerase/thioredoxin